MRLALFSPLSPLQTAVADHAEGLLPHLAEFADIDLFIEDGYVPNSPLVKPFAVYSHREFAARASTYDMVIYHMGDEPTYHGYIYKALQEHPGIVVLHDLVLHHCLFGLTAGRGNPEGYLDEMRYAYGKEGEMAAYEVLSGRGLNLTYRYPLMERVLDNSLGVIVHNHYAQRELARRRPGLATTVIGQHFFLPQEVNPDEDREALREQLGLKDHFVVATFGLLIPDKQLDIALRAFALFRRTHPEAVYLLVGPESGFDLTGTIQSMGLQDAVRMTGWQAPPDFVRHMLAVDVALHLRYPHVGGTPYTPIRLMGLGVPTIVTNIEPLAKIPEGCCIKVEVDEHEEETLLAILEYLATHEAARQQIAEKGRRYILEEHHPHKIAQQYKAFIEQIRSAGSPSAPTRLAPLDWQQYLIEEVAAILAGWGVDGEEEGLLLPIAETIAGLGLGPQASAPERTASTGVSD